MFLYYVSRQLQESLRVVNAVVTVVVLCAITCDNPSCDRETAAAAAVI